MMSGSALGDGQEVDEGVDDHSKSRGQQRKGLAVRIESEAVEAIAARRVEDEQHPLNDPTDDAAAPTNSNNGSNSASEDAAPTRTNGCPGERSTF
ncbi:hypothetical protein EJ03DRAFT_188190 [Teratosphaeria nubilosa]|uniref:Uncharacterized protein n=1 Tax=Teratosphaeria nubilosa TaxID=161662 RepID=A0A6G1LI67_9PEZI|nr:hypothetical protein EJ03DRAFT_188190 [Teratosphaeria nubilosa]